MVKVEVDDHHALVLFDFLARELDDRKAQRLNAAMEHPAEYWVLSGLQAQLEKLIPGAVAANYPALVDDARKKVIAESDPEGSYRLSGG